MSRRQALLRCPLFQDVPEEAVRMVEDAVVERAFGAGEVIVTQEARGDALYLLTRGRARVVRVSLGGRGRVLGFLYAPAVFGELAVLSQRERGASVIADSAVSALMLYRAEFEQLLARYPKVLWNLARTLAERVAVQNDELIAMGISTEASMAHLFVNLHRQRVQAGEEDPALLPLSPADLMLRLSSSRETVARVLRKLEKDGLARPERGGVRVQDPERLEHLLHGLEE